MIKKALTFFGLSTIAIFLVFLSDSLGFQGKSTKIEKFAAKIVEYVIKKDITSIYNLGTEGFKRSVSKSQLKDMIDTVLSFYKGKPIGGEFVRSKFYPSINAHELWFKLNFDDNKWLFIGCVIQIDKGKLSLYSLRLKAPPQFVKGMVYPPNAEPIINFAKKVVVLISKGKLKEVLSLIDEKVKSSVGEDFIISFLTKLKGYKLGEVREFKQNFLKEGEFYFIRFSGGLMEKPVDLELTFRRKNKVFKILDINSYQR